MAKITISKGDIREMVSRILNEVRYLNNDYISNYPKQERNAFETEPLRNDEVIRVFHGFTDIKQAVITAKNGLTGKSRVQRNYSYEYGMNPIGLFVSQSFTVVKRKFDYGGVIMEFSTKLSNLDYPVWNGQGSYFGVGSDPRPFKNATERSYQRGQYEIDADHSDMEAVRNSENPALANSLLNKSEKQALFVGDLNPNQIKYFWVKRGYNKWERLTRKEFLKEYGNTEYDYEDEIKQGIIPQSMHGKLYMPNEKWQGWEDFRRRLTERDKGRKHPFGEHMYEIVKEIIDDFEKNDEMNPNGDNFDNAYKTLKDNWRLLKDILYPKQLMAIITPEVYYQIESNGIYDRVEEPEGDIW